MTNITDTAFGVLSVDMSYLATSGGQVFVSFVNVDAFDDLIDTIIMDQAVAEADQQGWIAWDDLKRELGIP